ncbi:Transcription initiation factor IIF [Abeliophyllum distichum]|uniref:Transcription initiation factor IIF n=1 Tax=Abeliophyllum distichum TaxID=126358 RepID=A0ABD1SCD1_9LAMI
MEDSHSDSSSTIDTAKAERSVWLMKCPPVVSQAWQAAAATDSPPVAKVVVSLDLLSSEEPSALHFTMEMAGSEAVNVPKSYSLNMSKDIVPMCVFLWSGSRRSCCGRESRT